MYEHLPSFMKPKTPSATPARRGPLRLEALESRIVLDATMPSATFFWPPAISGPLMGSLVAAPTTALKPGLPPTVTGGAQSSRPPAPNNGAVWATVTTSSVAPTSSASGTMDVSVTIHLANLNGVTPTGFVYSGSDAAAIDSSGEALFHISTTGGMAGANRAASNDFKFTYSGDRNFAPATWLLSELTAGSTANPLSLLAPNAVTSQPLSNTGAAASVGQVVSVLSATGAPSTTSNVLPATVKNDSTGAITPTGYDSTTSTVAPPSALPVPMRAVLDTALFGDLGQAFWLSPLSGGK